MTLTNARLIAAMYPTVENLRRVRDLRRAMKAQKRKRAA